MAGLIQQKIKSKDWLFGSSPIVNDIILVKNGNWEQWITPEEEQVKRFLDTWGCVSFSGCKCVQTDLNYKLEHNLIPIVKEIWLEDKGYLVNGKFNVSDRYIAKLANTKVGYGATYRGVGDAIRNHGLIPEHLWPFEYEMIEEEYYKEIPQELLDLGQEFKEKFPIYYELVHIDRFEEAFKYAPLQIGVNAWYENEDGLYYNPKDSQNHAIMGYKKSNISDSYKPFKKELVENYNYGYWSTKYYIDINKNMEQINLHQNTFVQLVEGQGGFGLYLDDRIIIDDTDKIIASWMLRNSKDGVFENGYTRALTQEQWNKFPKTNLKGESINI